jgi:hypothetical protein
LRRGNQSSRKCGKAGSVDEVQLVREGAELTIVLRGDPAAILTFATNKKRPDLLLEAGFS